MSRILIGTLALVAMASEALGQRTRSIEEVAALRVAIASGDALSLRNAVMDDCGRALGTSRNAAVTITMRAASAREASRCVRASSAALLLLAAPDRVMQLRDVLAAVQGEVDAEKREIESGESFLGLRWGLGLGISLGADDNIDDAEIVNGVVRVKSDIKNQPRALFEYHKYFWCNENGTSATQGCGPFVAAAATEKKVLSGVGIGLMYGRRSRAADSEGFSIGIGALMDASVKSLGDGFRRNQAPPAGETAVRFATRSRWSTLVFVSRAF